MSVVSVSWPTAEISGIAEAAAARTTISSLNAIRSSRLPPPRATMRRSGRGTLPPGDTLEDLMAVHEGTAAPAAAAPALPPDPPPAPPAHPTANESPQNRKEACTERAQIP